jgi:integrase
VTHHGAILDPAAAGGLLRAIDGYNGQPLTALALKLTPHVFVRPGELRRAEWSEFDLRAELWTIPARKNENATCPCCTVVGASNHIVAIGTGIEQ